MGILEKLNRTIDLDRIVSEVNDIRCRFPFPQVCLTHTGKYSNLQDQLLEGAGSNFNIETGSYRFDERDFSIFNEHFRDTYLFDVYKDTPNIGRFRIMTLNGPSCYTIHKDKTRRFHIAVKTNDKCLFIFPTNNKIERIPADSHVYRAETRLPHSFMNGSISERIHIVMDDLSTLLP